MARKKKRILVVEDDDGLRDLLLSFLEESGYDVIQAADGLEGMEKIREESIDLIIVDVMLPYVSGIGLVKISKQQFPERPVICVTGYGTSPERLAEEEHADRVLSKPFDLIQLGETISQLLS